MGFEPANTPNVESYQVFKCRTTQHKEIKSNLTRDLTLTFDSSLASRGPNPNVHHKENNVYPNPNLTSSYILTLTLTSIIRLYPNPNPNPNPNVHHTFIS